MSAANSGDAWDLRCLVREQLITFLQARYPQSLPLSRVRLQDPPEHPMPAEPPVSGSSSPPL
ncbi:MAG: mechanosensitive ion channel family protein, partial [Gammaproteobacteria bacterium]|nr:mechanosensitive ion channel family protein [Gammaproteobacteria bacterium]